MQAQEEDDVIDEEGEEQMEDTNMQQEDE